MSMKMHASIRFRSLSLAGLCCLPLSLGAGNLATVLAAAPQQGSADHCVAQVETLLPLYGVTCSGCNWSLFVNSQSADDCTSWCTLEYRYTEDCVGPDPLPDHASIQLPCGTTTHRTWECSPQGMYAGIRAYCKPCQ